MQKVTCCLHTAHASQWGEWLAPPGLSSPARSRFFLTAHLRNQPHWHFDHGLPASRTVRPHISVVYVACLWSFIKSKVKSLSCVQLFATPWTVTCQAPPSMGFIGGYTGVGFHFLLQGIFPTQGSNPGLLHCRQTLYRLSHQGSLYKDSPSKWTQMDANGSDEKRQVSASCQPCDPWEVS